MEMSISYLIALPLYFPPPPPPSQLRGAKKAVGTGGGRTTAGWAALTFLQSMGRSRPRGAWAVLEPPAGCLGSYKAVGGAGFRLKLQHLSLPEPDHGASAACASATVAAAAPALQFRCAPCTSQVSGIGNPFHPGHAHTSFSDTYDSIPPQDPKTL